MASLSISPKLDHVSAASVHLFHGVYERHLPLAGMSLEEAKTRLPFRLPYFAEAVVNGKPVVVHHVLQGGDLLTFIRPPGFKAAGKREHPDKIVAQRMLSAYPELVEIANTVKQEAKAGDWDADKIVEMMTKRVARWVEDHFGPLPNYVMATVNEVVKQLHNLGDRASRMRRGDHPKKPGRKNTTHDLADFADARHPQQTWKDISEEWNTKHPTTTVTHHKVRDAWRRRYGDKSMPSKKSRGEI